MEGDMVTQIMKSLAAVFVLGLGLLQSGAANAGSSSFSFGFGFGPSFYVGSPYETYHQPYYYAPSGYYHRPRSIYRPVYSSPRRVCETTYTRRWSHHRHRFVLIPEQNCYWTHSRRW
jgi:hypothetical protein